MRSHHIREDTSRWPTGDLTVITFNVEGYDIAVRDSDNGDWWPSDEAIAEIYASDDPDGTAVAICRDQPMRGHWAY